nr:MAG TPA: hypothetical protein [Caudoviricetes sp.]DAY17188.1 MAG TPA: hypothetical protein [Caudoviricetes sp.]
MITSQNCIMRKQFANIMKTPHLCTTIDTKWQRI